MAYRDRILTEAGTRAADALPDAADAVAELFGSLATHVLKRYPDRFRQAEGGLRRADGATVPRDASITTLGRLVQEDFCLLDRPDGADEHRLIAANLCFPSHWRLPDKLGRPLLAIHAPAPGYAEGLGARVERVHAALAVERPLQRLNYSIQSTPELRLYDVRHGRSTPDVFYLRVERQTLRRLPETRAVVFGIKTYATPFEDLPTEAQATLADRLEAMTPAEQGYKGGEAYIAEAASRLRRLAAAAAADAPSSFR